MGGGGGGGNSSWQSRVPGAAALTARPPLSALPGAGASPAPLLGRARGRRTAQGAARAAGASSVRSRRSGSGLPRGRAGDSRGSGSAPGRGAGVGREAGRRGGRFLEGERSQRAWRGHCPARGPRLPARGGRALALGALRAAGPEGSRPESGVRWRLAGNPRTRTPLLGTLPRPRAPRVRNAVRSGRRRQPRAPGLKGSAPRPRGGGGGTPRGWLRGSTGTAVFSFLPDSKRARLFLAPETGRRTRIPPTKQTDAVRTVPGARPSGGGQEVGPGDPGAENPFWEGPHFRNEASI